jgi:glutamyl-tRNA synthetase
MAAGRKPRYDGRCRDRRGDILEGTAAVVRFRTPPEGIVNFDDQVRGVVSFQNTELDDLILARADGSPTYNLAAVVDDVDMGVTHVIRGEDHLNNTPRQIHIIEAMNARRPTYVHIPMINGSDGKKLSKRHGATSVLEYRDDGFIPDALLNYLARLGWSHGDQELFSREEMIGKFDIADINKSAANFDVDKLLWVNQQYIQTLSTGELASRARPFFVASGIVLGAGDAIEDVVDAQRSRAKTLVEVAEKSRPFFGESVALDAAAAKKHLRPVVEAPLRELRENLETVTLWDVENLQVVIEEVAAAHELKLGKIAQPLRVAVTGSTASPSIYTTLELIGREQCLKRLEQALAYIEARIATP